MVCLLFPPVALYIALNVMCVSVVHVAGVCVHARVCVPSFTSSPLPSGGVGILDPCEHEAVDASGAMTPQEREDVTAAAQVGHTCTHAHTHTCGYHV